MKIVNWTAFASATLVLGLVAAGCGSGGGSAAPGASGTSTAGQNSGGSYRYGGGSSSAGSSAAASVEVADSPLGKILVSGDGKTLYLFEADTGAQSTCDGACAGAWPPFTTNGAPKAAMGAGAGLLGTTKRSDGTTQVTYAGHPLYWFAGDSQPGDTAGEGLTGFGAAWYAVSPAGKAVGPSGS